MGRLEALTELAESVGAGCWDGHCYFHEISNDIGLTAYGAFSGSLDAAKSLHEAVLPGWPWSIKTLATDSVQVWTDFAYGLRRQGFIGTTKDCPARAWLLAIIRALIEQEAAA